MPLAFIDTNIAVYAVDSRDPAKQATALQLLRELLNRREAVVSAQVLVEFASVARTKLQIAPRVVQRQVLLLATGRVVPVDAELVCTAIDLQVAHQVSFWDACIVCAAEAAGCELLYTEDLSHGQRYGRLRVVNPFAGPS